MVRNFVQIMKSWIHHEVHEWLHIHGWITRQFESHMYFHLSHINELIGYTSEIILILYYFMKIMG
jgi:hypothetical protein